MRLIVFFFATCYMLFSQQQIPDVAGIWQFSSGTFSAVIQIQQSGTGLVGVFTPVQKPTSAFTAKILSPSSSGLNLILTWNTSRTDVPGQAVSYFGLITADGARMNGTYGVSPSQTVGSWSASRLSRLGPAISGVRSGASGASGSIAPGEIISIFANVNTNPIGPIKGLGVQLDANGKVSTVLGDVQVHFLPIDVYAPLIFASGGQVNAIVPYEIAGLKTVQIQVQYLGQISEPVTMQVAATAPAIFTANGSGVGPGAILNHDGITLNGPKNPEPRGGYVVLFVTGEGQTTPPGVSGKITNVASEVPLTPKPLESVEVRINGQVASVQFIGEAPYLVAGILQLNVQIPMAISSGNVPIQVVIGGKASPDGVTVTVQ